MKIAHIIPVMTTVPPRKYGGIESVVEELSRGLVAKGHEVTIFGAKGSGFTDVPINIYESAPFPTIEDLSQNRKWEVKEFLDIIAHQDEYDLIHFHYEPWISRVSIDGNELNLMDFIHKPFLVTIHNSTNIDQHIEYYKTNKKLWDYEYAFLSKSHARPLDFFPNKNVVYNGIPVDRFSFGQNAGDYLLFIGRITKVKGIKEAIEVALAVGKKLIIGAKIDPTDKVYYETEIAPFIDGEKIKYVGELDFQAKAEYYKNAFCTLFPVQWEEPFGLVMAESLACGTPVIGFNKGSVPEVIEDGVTGYVVGDISEMIEKVSLIDKIDRKKCRDRAKKLFDSSVMVENYLKIYERFVK